MNPRPPQDPPDEAILAIVLIVGAIFLAALAVSLLIHFFFGRTVARCLEKVHPDNRELEPGSAYLIMIPLFNLYWAFRVAAAVSDSLDNEFHDRRWRPNGDFGREIGKWWAICHVCGLIPYLGGLFGLAGFILFILYWVKVAEVSRELDSDDGPDPDYGHRRKSRRRDDDEHDDRE